MSLPEEFMTARKAAIRFTEPTALKSYVPSRFEGKELVPFSYVPFGGGPRTCPGREYAQLQLLVFLHNVVKRHRWEKLFSNEKMIYKASKFKTPKSRPLN
ncbi:hypothetical protein CICLE_v10010017mg [Citrus x clementina]|uniref:Cytochrome P450 n=1 Tax=Citrus clementina TaxID=85681 RepID=V4UGN3_CITCL|nr:hypothetical protein CICLE_v10010017mg [Citrus x clementina]